MLRFRFWATWRKSVGVRHPEPPVAAGETELTGGSQPSFFSDDGSCLFFSFSRTSCRASIWGWSRGSYWQRLLIIFRDKEMSLTGPVDLMIQKQNTNLTKKLTILITLFDIQNTWSISYYPLRIINIPNIEKIQTNLTKENYIPVQINKVTKLFSKKFPVKFSDI